ncbi:MAG: cyclic nucleotide-binding domain-containing protein [Polyangiaceae bacterium]
MRNAPPVLPGSGGTTESPSDRALALTLAGERDAALRWAAAILKADPAAPLALILVGRHLGEANRQEVAREACTVAIERAIDLENLPLAVIAAREAERFGADIGPLLDGIADAFASTSRRFGAGAVPPAVLPDVDSFQPLASVLGGTLLNNKATEIVHEARAKLEKAERPGLNRQPLFSALDAAALRQLCEGMRPEWFAADHVIIEQGTQGEDAFWLARGELEARRTRRGATIPLARLKSGALFGEMALLSRTPRAGSVVALRPSVVVRINKATLDAVAAQHPIVATEIGVHCRDRMVSNLLKTSEVLKGLPEADLPALIQRFQIQTFEQNEHILEQDEVAKGIHLIASGEITMVRRDAESDPLVLGTLGAGDVAADVAAVFRRKTNVALVASQPTVTLVLPVGEVVGIAKTHPAILAQLYVLAAQHDEETTYIMDEEASVAEDFDLI